MNELKATKKERMYERIIRHGEKLKDIFNLDVDPVFLCKQLRRLELRANRKMCDYCNGDIDDKQLQEYILGELKPRLIKVLGGHNVARVYINHDPRGYTLKLNELESHRYLQSMTVYQDWGGYVILAPDFTEN